MTYNTADVAKILIERLPPEHWADMLLCDLPDDAMETVVERIESMNMADRDRVSAQLGKTPGAIDAFINAEGAAINARGRRIPVMISPSEPPQPS